MARREPVVPAAQVWAAVQAPRWRWRARLVMTTQTAVLAPQSVAALWVVPA